MPPREDLLTRESTPIWFNVKKEVEFDESTVRTILLQNPPVTTNSVTALNTNAEIRFEYNPSADQVIHLSDKNTCLRLRCSFYTSATQVGPPWQSGTVPAVLTGANAATTTMNNNADITFENAWFSNLFGRAEFYLGGSTPMDLIQFFPIWYQLMCHLQPLDFKMAIGEQIGYIPDEVSGLPVDNTTPYLLLSVIGGAAVAPGASGSFGVVATLNGGAAGIPATAAAATVYWYTIPGTGATVVQGTGVQIRGGIKIPLFIPANIPAGTTVTHVFQIANPLDLAAAGSYTWQYGGGVLVLGAGAAVAQWAAISIRCSNTTGAALNHTAAAGNVPVAGSTMQLPILCSSTNLYYYEPGYAKRKRIYNYTQPNGTGQPRTFEVMIPLYYLFGFCNNFNRLISNLSLQIKLLRDTTASPFLGVPGTDGFLQINEAYLQIAQIVPEDEFKVEFNRAIDSPIEMGFLTPLINQFTITSQTINQIVPTGSYKPDYVFIIFKDQTQNSSQVNASLNCNADVQNLQVNLGGQLYPLLPQDAKWNIQGDGVHYTSKFYEQYRECCTKLTGECSMTKKQWRELYPIFAFDLTAQQTKVRNQATQVVITGIRNSNTPTNVIMYVVVLYEKYFEAKYLRNEISPKSS